MIRWKVWYRAGTFSSYDGAPEDAPKVGVQVIAQEHPDHGRQLVTHPRGYYWWTEDMWYGGDEVGFWQHMFAPGAKIVLFGESIPTARFRQIYQAANEDPWLPPRSATGPDEAAVVAALAA